MNPGMSSTVRPTARSKTTAGARARNSASLVVPVNSLRSAPVLSVSTM